MLSRQITKSLSLYKSETRHVLSGVEKQYGKTVHMVKLENDSRIYTIIPKYSNNVIIEVIVIYQDLVTMKFDFRTIVKFKKHQPSFGFNVKWAEGLLDLEPGTELESGTVLATTESIDDFGNLNVGTNVNVAFTSHLETAEDAFIISEPCRNKFAYDKETEHVAKLNSNDIPLNLYGTIDKPMVLPKVGDKVPGSGYIFASRKFNNEKLLTQFTKKSLTKLDPMFDDCLAVRDHGGVVSDIVVTFNKQAYKRPIMPELEEQLFHYVRQQESYEDAFIKAGRDIASEYGYGAKFDNELHAEQVRLRMLRHPGIRPIKKKSTLETFNIKIKVKHHLLPNKSYKLASYSGHKGIISDIWPEERMPVDIDGNRADLLLFSGSTIGRMNVGGLYEQYINGAVVKVSKVIRDNFNTWGVDKTYNYLLGFLKLFGNEQYEHFLSLDNFDRNEVLEDICKTSVYVYLPVDNDKLIMDITIDIANSKEYRPPKGPVSFVSEGEKVITNDSILIAPMHLMLLSKTGSTWLSVSSPKLNHYGIPTAPQGSSSRGLTWSPNPVRFGNTEFRLYAAYGSPELLVMIKERANSLEVQRLVYRNILKADKPTDIEDVAPTSEVPYGSDIIVNLISNVLGTFGIGLGYVNKGWE